MGKFVDLTGQKFGRLTVIRREDNPQKRGVMWLCKCDCGNEFHVISHDLTAGIKRSCGCYREDWEESKHTDIVGQRFGRLVVLRYSHKVGKRLYFECRCDCGKIIATRKDSLLNGHTTSCGCRWEEVRNSPDRGKTHGLTRNRAYRLWMKIKQRCYNENTREYPNYGGRGVVMCDEWLNNPETFVDWCYANGYNDKAPKGECTIDRIDVNGNYEPSNCRFITNLEQQNNRRDTKRYLYNGEEHTASEWSRILNIPYPTLSAGLHREGKDIEYFLTKYKPRK